jgi:hypothetical protein
MSESLPSRIKELQAMSRQKLVAVGLLATGLLKVRGWKRR